MKCVLQSITEYRRRSETSRPRFTKEGQAGGILTKQVQGVQETHPTLSGE